MLVEQHELFAIDSPCIQVCEMDDKGYCKGCLRNRTERDLWQKMNNSQKRYVLRLLTTRRLKRQNAKRQLSLQATNTTTLTELSTNFSLFANDINNDTL